MGSTPDGPPRKELVEEKIRKADCKNNETGKGAEERRKLLNSEQLLAADLKDEQWRMLEGRKKGRNESQG